MKDLSNDPYSTSQSYLYPIPKRKVLLSSSQVVWTRWNLEFCSCGRGCEAQEGASAAFGDCHGL